MTLCILYYVRRKGWKLGAGRSWARAKLERNLPIKHYQMHRSSSNAMAIRIYVYSTVLTCKMPPPPSFYEEIYWLKVLSHRLESICLDTNRHKFKYSELCDRAARENISYRSSSNAMAIRIYVYSTVLTCKMPPPPLISMKKYTDCPFAQAWVDLPWHQPPQI